MAETKGIFQGAANGQQHSTKAWCRCFYHIAVWALAHCLNTFFNPVCFCVVASILIELKERFSAFWSDAHDLKYPFRSTNRTFCAAIHSFAHIIKVPLQSQMCFAFCDLNVWASLWRTLRVQSLTRYRFPMEFSTFSGAVEQMFNEAGKTLCRICTLSFGE